ncbi:coiled-coil domain-containing protein 180 [Symphorus nematophorus]
MSKGRVVPSGEVYRPMFEAQAQLSRALHARRRDRRTDCLSAEDSNPPCSTTRRRQRSDIDNDIEAVRALPDTVVVHGPRSDFLERLTERRSKNHKETLKQMETELTDLAQECETQVRTDSEQLLSFLQQADLRLNTLKDRMEQQEHNSLKELNALWEEVEKEGKMKKTKVLELNDKLTETEAQRSVKLDAILKKHCQLLENISFLPPPDIHKLINNEAMMLNQSLLNNRRSVAHLVWNLRVMNVEKESLLRLHWEACLSHWRGSRITEVVDHFSSLVPPSCSTDLVSDWFSQLTAVNQQIDSLHADRLHQLRCFYEQMWQHRLSELECCKEALSALGLSEEEVNDIVSSQFLTLSGQTQSQDEKLLAGLDVSCDSVARHALSLSRGVFVVMRGAALLWETHSSRLERREEELQQQLDKLRDSQQKHIQASCEDALKMSLDKTFHCLEEIKCSCSVFVSDQCQLLDRLPSHFLEELLSYSSSLSSFYHIDHMYTRIPEDLQKLCSPSTTGQETSEEQTENQPISCQNDTDPAQPAQDWLTEAESSLQDLCDFSVEVTFKSDRGESYIGPYFRCPNLNVKDNPAVNLSLFPAELLETILNSIWTLFLHHLEQHFDDVLYSAIDTVTDMKQAAYLELLKQLNLKHIQTHIYQPRLAELQLHRRHVDAHCEEMLDMLTSCKEELQELQTSISRRNNEFNILLCNMEDDVDAVTLDSSGCLEAVSSVLQDRLDEHIKHTQSRVSTFRRTVQISLQEVRNRTTQLLNSFRPFSEGGDFAPAEMRLFQSRLKTETKQMSVTEKSIYSELEVFQSKSLKQLDVPRKPSNEAPQEDPNQTPEPPQLVPLSTKEQHYYSEPLTDVKKASARLEEKISYLKSEVKFTEKIQRIIGSTKVQIKAEAAKSNQQQVAISSMLEDLWRMVKDTQVSPAHVCSFLSSVNEELMKRCQYLEVTVEKLFAPPKSRKQVQVTPPAVLPPLKRTSEDFLDDPIMDILNNLRRGSSIGKDRGFHVFGPEPEQNPESLSSMMNSVLWKANDNILQVAKDFYKSQRSGLSWSHCLPLSLDQWVENTQQILLGLQEQTRKLLSTSKEELVRQLSVFGKLMCSSPRVLISNHEQRQGVELIEEVGGVRLKLEETLAASEKDKHENVRRLRVSMTDNELETVISREELRQQQLQSTICSAHLQLQECVQVRGEHFVTSLASLTENLILQMDKCKCLPAETETVTSHQHTEDSTVTTETEAETRQKSCTVRRTWSGIPYLSTADPPSSVTTVMTASITTTRCTMGHLTVIEQRDAAVKVY